MTDTAEGDNCGEAMTTTTTTTTTTAGEAGESGGADVGDLEDARAGSPGSVVPCHDETRVYRITVTQWDMSEGRVFSSRDVVEDVVAYDDANRMLEAGEFSLREDVEALWKQKNRMDNLFDSEGGHLYYQERDRQFPLDQRGSSLYWNRAGDKLDEVCESVGLLDHLVDTEEEEVFFADVCGGPGAFSQMVMEWFQSRGRRVSGVGVTLRNEIASTQWYTRLLRDPRFTAVWGKKKGPGGRVVDADGDIYLYKTIRALRDAASPRCSVVVADGGFKIAKDANGQHKENLQEVFSARIILSEMLAALTVLQRQGGVFCCKLFDSFSYLTVSLIFVCAQVFEECYVVKPRRSRVCNSERYLVGKRVRQRPGKDVCPDGDLHDHLRCVLRTLHEKCFDKEQMPRSAVPIPVMTADSAFVESIRHMNADIAHHQTRALTAVMDAVDLRRLTTPKQVVRPSDYNQASNMQAYMIAKKAKKSKKRRRRRKRKRTDAAAPEGEGAPEGEAAPAEKRSRLLGEE